MKEYIIKKSDVDELFSKLDDIPEWTIIGLSDVGLKDPKLIRVTLVRTEILNYGTDKTREGV